MFEQLKRWFGHRQTKKQAPPAVAARRPVVLPKKRPAATQTKKPQADVSVETHVSGKIESAGPGKNVLIRNNRLQDDADTLDSLKILDDDDIKSADEDGIDPYNTGRFDRSKNWDKRFLK